MKIIRHIHLYIGVLFTPLLLYFLFSGVVQMFGLHYSGKGEENLPAWRTSIQRSTMMHRTMRSPFDNKGFHPFTLKEGDSKYWPYYLAVTLMVLGMGVSALLGVGMAIRFSVKKWPVIMVLVAGILMPVIFMFWR